MQLRVLFIKDSITKTWVAQGLEHDIAALGKTVQEAQREFERIFRAELAYRKKRGERGLLRIKPAPLFYHKLYEPDQAVRAKAERSNFLYHVLNRPNAGLGTKALQPA